MNSESPNSPEDRLLDELLREQANGPDEAFLKSIESAIDTDPVQVRKPAARRWAPGFAIAATVTLVAGTAVWMNSGRPTDVPVTTGLTDAYRMQPDGTSSPAVVARPDPTLERELAAAPGPGAAITAPPADRSVAALEEKGKLDEAREFGNNADRVPLEGLTREVAKAKTSMAAADELRSNRRMGAEVAGMPSKAPASAYFEADAARLGIVREGSSGDRYGTFIDQPWKTPDKEPLSTFSIDVDTASYGNVRRMIREGRSVPRDAVRIEECINAFRYSYAQPQGEGSFAVGAALAVCPWEPKHQLVRIAIKGREIEKGKRPSSNLVFLIDVSGSMQSPDKLPLLKQSMEMLVGQLDERDRVAIVVYAGSEGVALPSTRLDAEGREKVLKALAKLEAGGSTNGGAGIKRAYELATKEKIEGGVNRVILATDGDFNVGVTGQGSLVEMVKDRAKSGVYLTVLGFGTGNLNDGMMDAITRDGNGNYFYVDSEREGKKVFLQNLTGTLVTIAKDVKIQVEFNPAKVGSYRLIGYSNRVLRNEDFNNDKVDAGDIGAGHTVTAFYELTPPGTGGVDGLKYQAAPAKPAAGDEWLTVKLRYKHPDGDESRKIEFPLTGDPVSLDQTDADYQFATAAALFGMKLRGMEEVKDIGWDQVIALAKPGLANDADEDRSEFVDLLKKLNGKDEVKLPAPAEIAPGSLRAIPVTPPSD